MNIILSGPPGSGKGTQSNLLCNNKKLDLIKISVGDILRNNIKKKTKEIEIINSGKLISNDIVFNLVNKVIEKNKGKNFLFDGFPRTLEQSKFFNIYNLEIKYFIQLTISTEKILDRLVNGRLIHEKSGRIYHEKYNPPKIKNLDDITKEKLIKRNDDNKDIILNRINLYNLETKKLINFYKKENKSIKFIEVEANDDIHVIQKNILNNLI